MKWTSYDKATGRILYFGDATTEEEALLQGDNVLIGEAHDDAEFYIVDGKAEPRPTLEVESNILHSAHPSDMTSIPVPLGTTIRYKDGEAVTDGSDFGFMCDTVGTWEFEFEPPFPFKSKKVTIHVL